MGPAHPTNPGITLAWIGLDDGESIDESELRSTLWRDGFDIPIDDPDRVTRWFLDAAARGLTADRGLDLGFENEANPGLVDFAMSANIVIERSPPSWITLETVLKGSPRVIVGTFLGATVAAPYYPLMLITVPAGIIVVGAAIGVSKGLEAGLNQAIKRNIKKWLR
jgi:hypothetical protein